MPGSGVSFNVQTHFSLNKFLYTSDISKAYFRIIVEDITKGLRLFIWYDDEDVEMKHPFYFLRCTMDFGDGVASAILTIAQKKIVAPLCKFAMSSRIIISQAYADNYCGSFKSQKIYHPSCFNIYSRLDCK